MFARKVNKACKLIVEDRKNQALLRAISARIELTIISESEPDGRTDGFSNP